MKNLFGRLSLSLLSISLLALTVISQDLDDVTLAGRVTDSNGLAIVGAAVKATLVDTGAERTVTTNDDGRFRLIELKPGLYKVTVSQNGFGTKERTDLQTISGQNLQIDFQLAPADVKADATVTVTEEDTPAVDVTRTIVGGTVTQREIEELPNNTRDPLDLVFTLGGVTEEPLSTRNLSGDRGTRGSFAQGSTPEEAGTFALSGGAAYSNNITIDGLDNNDDRSAGFRFQPSIDAVAEVQVITNQFSSEYGRASGGRVNIRTRAGSNKFRGR
ncbi:MAG: carboxypeptidase-like regulatory domain-containing protein, partial [Pyrinomonadaceae bacterium]